MGSGGVKSFIAPIKKYIYLFICQGTDEARIGVREISALMASTTPLYPREGDTVRFQRPGEPLESGTCDKTVDAGPQTAVQVRVKMAATGKCKWVNMQHVKEVFTPPPTGLGENGLSLAEAEASTEPSASPQQSAAAEMAAERRERAQERAIQYQKEKTEREQLEQQRREVMEQRRKQQQEEEEQQRRRQQEQRRERERERQRQALAAAEEEAAATAAASGRTPLVVARVSPLLNPASASLCRVSLDVVSSKRSLLAGQLLDTILQV